VYFEATQKVLNPSIPLDEGDRVIAVQNWETLAAPEDPFALHELAMGRTDLRSIAELGAAMRFQRNLVTPDGRMEAVRGAEITASAFQLARVKPLLGRPLLPSDEDVNAAPAAVIGYSLWQSQFDGNAGAVGGTVKLGSINATVVGVMPEGFAFPFAEQIWTTMRLTPAQLGTFRKSNAGPGRPNLSGVGFNGRAPRSR
jgi:hypothetical protein